MPDTLIVNTAQADAGNGYEGEHWAANDDRYDIVNSGFNGPLLDAAGIGETSRVLDVGCGNGKLTRLAASRARHGQVTGLDLSGPMLARARARAAEEGIGNVTFEQGDAQVYPLPAGGFDVSVSRFGVMFFGDPVAAFANIGRGLRPGGRLAFACLTCPARTSAQCSRRRPCTCLRRRLRPRARRARSPSPIRNGLARC
jgi:ubiquinone/menaquinone biosynthesis C-methylase UbiE